MREVHRVIADTILLSDKFDAMAARVVGQTAPDQPASRSPWSAPARPG